MKILNLTQHPASREQIEAGVIDPPAFEKKIVSDSLTFDSLPDANLLKIRAETLALYASGVTCDAVMIGGAPFFMPHLDKALRAHNVRPLYAFSTREVVEETQADGSVRKVSVFRHAGFVG